jgi:predicted TPR repeat methyltransferase
MKDLIEKLIEKEREITQEKGELLLFGLFLREDASDQWDLVVAAPWITEDKATALKYLASKVQEALTPEQLLKLSRIVLIEETNPSLKALQKEIQAEDAVAELHDRELFGLPMRHAYVITGRHSDEHPVKDTAEATP